MAAGPGKLGGGGGHEDTSGADLYAVLGLNRECTDADLRVAYRRLAMVWHPDKCSARAAEAKERFQEIQGAYSVLSDSNKRFLYDVGVYDSEDDDDDMSGMGDFLGEMADMMSQATPTESFEELQQLFVDMFQPDLEAAGFCTETHGGHRPQVQSTAACRSSSPTRTPVGRRNVQAPAPRNGLNNKRGSSEMDSSRPARAGSVPDLVFSGFVFKVSESKTRQAPWTDDVSGGDRSSSRKQRLATSRDVSGGGDASRVSRQSGTSCR